MAEHKPCASVDATAYTYTHTRHEQAPAAAHAHTHTEARTRTRQRAHTNMHGATRTRANKRTDGVRGAHTWGFANIVMGYQHCNNMPAGGGGVLAKLMAIPSPPPRYTHTHAHAHTRLWPCPALQQGPSFFFPIPFPPSESVAPTVGATHTTRD